MKGKTYLKVTGILLLIGGILGVLCYGCSHCCSGLPCGPGHRQRRHPVTAIVVVYVIASIIQLVAGVMGIKGCNKSSKADGCLKSVLLS